jgi:hypothetical protein
LDNPTAVLTSLLSAEIEPKIMRVGDMTDIVERLRMAGCDTLMKNDVLELKK